MGFLLYLIIIVGAVLFYFLPWLIAGARNHHLTGIIAVINIFLGSTGVGWLIALALACSRVELRNGFECSGCHSPLGTSERFCPGCGLQIATEPRVYARIR